MEEVGGAHQHALRVRDDEHRPAVVGRGDGQRHLDRQRAPAEHEVHAARRAQAPPLEIEALAQLVGPVAGGVEHDARPRRDAPARSRGRAPPAPTRRPAGVAQAGDHLGARQQQATVGGAGGGDGQGEAGVVGAPRRRRAARGRAPRSSSPGAARSASSSVDLDVPVGPLGEPVVHPQPEVDLPAGSAVAVVGRVEEATGRTRWGERASSRSRSRQARRVIRSCICLR